MSVPDLSTWVVWAQSWGVRAQDFVVWAQEQAAPAQPAAGQGNAAAPGQSSPFTMLFPLLAIGLLFYVMLIRPQQRRDRQAKAMIAALKKNDRVVTVSGIYGVVTNVRPDADEVTVRVDDTSNTRLRMTMSSILRVLGDETPSDKTSAS